MIKKKQTKKDKIMKSRKKTTRTGTRRKAAKVIDAFGQDVMEHKKAEEEIQALSRFPSENPNPMMRISKDGAVLYCNQAGLPILNHWKSQIGQLASSSWRQLVADVFESGIKREYEEEYGTEVFSLVLVPIVEAGYVNVYGRDITERKKAEEALKESEEKYRSIVETANEGIMVSDPNRHIIFVNQKFADVLGYTREELVGKKADDLFVEGQEKQLAQVREELDRGGRVHDEFQLNRKDGTVIWVHFGASGLVGVSGRHVGNLIMLTDITERKSAEEALRRLNEELEERVHKRTEEVSSERKRFIDVLEQLPAYLVLLTPDYHVSYANRFFRERFGEDHGRRCFEYLFGRTMPCENCGTYKTLETMSSREWEWTGPDGRKYYIYDSPFTEPDGSTRILEVGIDITERKNAEEKLHAVSRYARSLLEASLDPLVTISAEGKITDVNAATEEVTGCSREQLIGSDFSDYFTDPEKARKGYREVFSEGYVRDYPLAIRHKSGKITYVLYNATVYKNDKGEIQGVFAAARDVTARKQAEEKLREASLYSRSLIEASLDPLVTISAEGKITDVNKATEEITGFSREQLIGSDFSDYFTDPEEARKGYRRVFTEGFVIDYPLAIRNKSGKITDVLYNATVYRDEAGKIQGIFAAARDITERKRAEEALRKAHDELEVKVEERTAELTKSNAQLRFEIDERRKTEQKLAHLNAVLSAIRDANQLIAKEKERDKLLKGVCDELVKNLGYYNVWISLFDKSQNFMLAFESGLGDDFLPLVERFKSGGLNRCTLKALAQSTVVVTEDPPANCSDCPLAKMYKDRSALSARLEYGGSVYGVITAGIPASSIRYEEEKSLFAELASDIAFALHSIELDENRKKAEESLRETRNYLENLIDYANAPIIVWNPTYQITRFNHAFERLTGHNATDVLGKSLEILFPEDSKEESLRRIHQASSGEYWQIVEIPILRTDRNVRTILWNSANIHGKDETEVIATIAQGQDITERKQAEQSLYKAKQEWERTFDSVPDLIAILDGQHRIVRANRAMAQQLGTTPDQCMGLFCFECVHGKNAPIESCPHVKTLQDGQEHIEELHEDRLGGDFVVSTTPLRDEKGQMIGSVHVARNITERKRMEAKLEEYARHLEELVDEKTKQLKDAERLATIGQTAGMVGHDIRNPLQSIEGATYLAREELKSLPAESSERKELDEILKLIEDQTSYIDHVVSDLQDFAKPPMPQPQETDISNVINETLSMMEIPTNIQVQTTIQDGLQKELTEPTFLKRILLNLIENAIQAMPNGGNLAIKALKEQQTLYISVGDTGEGILEENKTKMFTPLFTTKAKGQGFGLSVCRKLVESLKGQISFESEHGKGTTFTIKLSLADRTN